MHLQKAYLNRGDSSWKLQIRSFLHCLQVAHQVLQISCLKLSQPISFLRRPWGEFLYFCFPRPNILFASWISWVSPLSWRECVNLEEAAIQQRRAHEVQWLDEGILVIDGCWEREASIFKDISLCLYSNRWPYTHAHIGSTKRTLIWENKTWNWEGKDGGEAVG